MVQFAVVFPDESIVVTVSGQLSWSYFVRLLPLKDVLQRDCYAQMSSLVMRAPAYSIFLACGAPGRRLTLSRPKYPHPRNAILPAGAGPGLHFRRPAEAHPEAAPVGCGGAEGGRVQCCLQRTNRTLSELDEINCPKVLTFTRC